MAWLREHGVINGYADYLRLPLGVLEDARLWMSVDLGNRAKEAQKQPQTTRGYPRGRRR